MKKFLVIGSVAAAALILTGCGSTVQRVAGNAPAAAQAQQPAQSAASENAVDVNKANTEKIKQLAPAAQNKMAFTQMPQQAPQQFGYAAQQPAPRPMPIARQTSRSMKMQSNLPGGRIISEAQIANIPNSEAMEIVSQEKNDIDIIKSEVASLRAAVESNTNYIASVKNDTNQIPSIREDLTNVQSNTAQIPAMREDLSNVKNDAHVIHILREDIAKSRSMPQNQSQVMPDDAMMGDQVVEVSIQNVYFDFDKFDIRNDMVSVVNNNASILRNAEFGAIRIEGNTDEWGTDEYNFALGNKRALAVKDALVSRGINPEKLITVSYGESKPTCTEKTEECWNENRKVTFEILQ